MGIPIGTGRNLVSTHTTGGFNATRIDKLCHPGSFGNSKDVLSAADVKPIYVLALAEVYQRCCKVKDPIEPLFARYYAFSDLGVGNVAFVDFC